MSTSSHLKNFFGYYFCVIDKFYILPYFYDKHNQTFKTSKLRITIFVVTTFLSLAASISSIYVVCNMTVESHYDNISSTTDMFSIISIIIQSFSIIIVRLYIIAFLKDQVCFLNNFSNVVNEVHQKIYFHNSEQNYWIIFIIIYGFIFILQLALYFMGYLVYFVISFHPMAHLIGFYYIIELTIFLQDTILLFLILFIIFVSLQTINQLSNELEITANVSGKIKLSSKLIYLHKQLSAFIPEINRLYFGAIISMALQTFNEGLALIYRFDWLYEYDILNSTTIFMYFVINDIVWLLNYGVPFSLIAMISYLITIEVYDNYYIYYIFLNLLTD